MEHQSWVVTGTKTVYSDQDNLFIRWKSIGREICSITPCPKLWRKLGLNPVQQLEETPSQKPSATEWRNSGAQDNRMEVNPAEQIRVSYRETPVEQ